MDLALLAQVALYLIMNAPVIAWDLLFGVSY